ncbi:GntR family transcriptional regulator (plasmid) [Azospirillum argentinense]|uniref:GntR family transcriptional regulator n=1 Tax=Azospirillum argentinense TaxID=2970906 RepID=A0A060DT10_9PROT|nr:PLP-dependent aminotransferase family protein [Azospirillum argentinense]AIB15830.1 GntR family transcriptional regulator [Azospirillum argentinense]EZQ03325.1 GntR family transcriptional regulator [Azospirillum argentinense]PNQ95849.1 PLP-dependent aminotransferase family protein [Azospirillum argentinense]
MTNRMGTRTVEVMDAIRQRMTDRRLSPGDRLPSIRRFATAMGVSPSTVVEAYDRLAADGVIRSRPGSGFYVSGTLPPLALAEAEPRRDRAIDPFWVSRQSLDADAGMLKPGCGWLPADWMPNAALRRALRRLAHADDSVLADYGSTRGSPALRRLLARQFAEEGIAAGAEQILLTGSGTQAIDLICRFLLRPGDAVLVDDPCYFNFQALLRAHQVRIVGVPYTQNGPDTALFAAALAEHRPRLYITNSALHNPTGATMSPQTAHRLLKAAAAHDVTIVEDDIFAGFEPDPSPRLAVLDGLSQVIRIGSFSKTLSASVRCGYLAARPEWVEALVDLQVATNFGGPSPAAAELVLATLGDGGHRKHLDGLRLRLARLRRETADRLVAIGLQPWLMPRGGFYLWCSLPDGRDAAAVARAALDEQVVLAPGNVFSVGQSAAGFLRFNVAQMGDPRVFEVLKRAVAAAEP